MKNRIVKINVTEFVALTADGSGNINHVLIKAVQSAPQFAELNDVFKMYRIRKVTLKFVPHSPTVNGIIGYQISLVDEDDASWTGSQGYSSNALIYEGVRIIPASKGGTIQVPFPGNTAWKEAEDEAYVGMSETGDAEAIELKAYSPSAYSASTTVHNLFITWHTEFKNLLVGSSH